MTSLRLRSLPPARPRLPPLLAAAVAAVVVVRSSLASECGSQGGGKTCPSPDECCSRYGFCDVGDSWCGEGCQDGPCYETAAPTPPPTPSLVQPPGTATAAHDDSRLIAYVGNWQECPTAAQTDAYTHVIVAFAVTYTWTSWKNECDEGCNIVPGNEDGSLIVCGESSSQSLVDSWRDAGKKVILSFGGAGMGGSWDGDQNNCWDYCFGREDDLSTALVDIVRRQRFDGIDIDYEYCYDVNGGKFKWTEGCPQKTELYSDAKAQTFLSEMTSLLRRKLDALGEGYELTHAPMDPDLMRESKYYQILKERSSDLDFLMPQFYNGYTQPAADGFDGQVAGRTKTSEIYGNLVDDVFGGRPEKVVFGFCIRDCNGATDGAGAVEVLRQVKAHGDGEYGCNGGAFFWVALSDAGGAWSDPVWEEVRKTSGCSHRPDETTAVSIKFEVEGLPSGVEIEAIRAEMTTITNRLFFRLEESIGGMKVSSVEVDESSSSNVDPIGGEGVATAYYKINISSEEDILFEYAIIQELRNSHEEMLLAIPFSDIRYITRDLDFNWCARTLEGYKLCVRNEPKVDESPSSVAVPPPEPASKVPPGLAPTVQSNSNVTDVTNRGPSASTIRSDAAVALPGWAIALVVLAILSLLACVAFLVFVVRRQDKSKGRHDVDDDAYFDDVGRHTDDGDAIAEHESWVKSSQSVSEWTRTSQSIEEASYGSRRTREALGRLAREALDRTKDAPGPEAGVVPGGRSYYDEDDLPPPEPRRDPSAYSVAGSASSRSGRASAATTTTHPARGRKRDPDAASVSSRSSRGSRLSAATRSIKRSLSRGRKKPDPDAASAGSRRLAEEPTSRAEPSIYSIA